MLAITVAGFIGNWIWHEERKHVKYLDSGLHIANTQ